MTKIKCITVMIQASCLVSSFAAVIVRTENKCSVLIQFLWSKVCKCHWVWWCSRL